MNQYNFTLNFALPQRDIDPEILGFTRQNMRKLLVESGPKFPLRVHDGKPAIWHLSTVLDWFFTEKG